MLRHVPKAAGCIKSKKQVTPSHKTSHAKSQNKSHQVTKQVTPSHKTSHAKSQNKSRGTSKGTPKPQPRPNQSGETDMGTLITGRQGVGHTAYALSYRTPWLPCPVAAMSSTLHMHAMRMDATDRVCRVCW